MWQLRLPGGDRVSKVYIGMGSNLGDRLGNISKAVELIKGINDVNVTAMSSIYETEPMDFSLQPNFLNAVLKVNTGLKPDLLLSKLQDIENRLGRVRTAPKGPRPIDLDILLYNSQIIDTDRLTVPHSRMWQRLFVLEPLKELDGDITLPSGETIQERCEFLKRSQKVRLFMKDGNDIMCR